MVRYYKRKTSGCRWTKEDLLKALISIKDYKLKVNDAVRQYGISRATLYRQLNRFVLGGGKYNVNQFTSSGGHPVLNKMEEDVLEKTILELREAGFRVMGSDIKRICFEYCDSNGIPNRFDKERRLASQDWYYGFLGRHPAVKINEKGLQSGRGTEDDEWLKLFEVDEGVGQAVAVRVPEAAVVVEGGGDGEVVKVRGQEEEQAEVEVIGAEENMEDDEDWEGVQEEEEDEKNEVDGGGEKSHEEVGTNN